MSWNVYINKQVRIYTSCKHLLSFSIIIFFFFLVAVCSPIRQTRQCRFLWLTDVYRAKKRKKKRTHVYVCGGFKKKKWGCKHHILCLFFFYYVVVVGAISFFFFLSVCLCVSVCLYPLQLNKLVKYVEDLQESHSDRRGGQKKKKQQQHENNDKTAPLHENGRWKNKKRESNKKE